MLAQPGPGWISELRDGCSVLRTPGQPGGGGHCHLRTAPEQLALLPRPRRRERREAIKPTAQPGFVTFRSMLTGVVHKHRVLDLHRWVVPELEGSGGDTGPAPAGDGLNSATGASSANRRPDPARSRRPPRRRVGRGCWLVGSDRQVSSTPPGWLVPDVAAAPGSTSSSDSFGEQVHFPDYPLKLPSRSRCSAGHRAIGDGRRTGQSCVP